MNIWALRGLEWVEIKGKVLFRLLVQNEIGVLDFFVRACPSARAKCPRQTDDARGVSGSVAAVDVVALQDLTDELLRDDVHLIGGLRTTEDPDPCATLEVGRGLEAFRRTVERFVPGGEPQHVVLANHGFGQSWQVRCCMTVLLERCVSKDHGGFETGPASTVR